MGQPKTCTTIGYGVFQYPAAADESAGFRIRRYGCSTAEATTAGSRAKDRTGQVSEFDLMAGPYIEAFFPLMMRMF
jgi:hypothetical protein